MAAAQKAPLRELSVTEQQALEQIARAGSERMDQVQRARALLAVAAGARFTRAAATAGYRSGDSVAQLVARFNARGLASLAIAPGRGRRATYDTAARAQVVARAQQPPQRAVDGTATWSLTTLQRAVQREGVGMSRSTLARVLHAAGSTPQQSRTWCPTGTALRKRKSGLVQVTDPQTEEKKP
jgi:transposase